MAQWISQSPADALEPGDPGNHHGPHRHSGSPKIPQTHWSPGTPEIITAPIGQWISENPADALEPGDPGNHHGPHRHSGSPKVPQTHWSPGTPEIITDPIGTVDLRKSRRDDGK